MVSFMNLAVASAILAFTSAAPVAESKGFSVKQVQAGPRFKHGATALKNAYHKYGAVVPDHVNSAVAATSTGSVVASPEQYDQAYLCPVTIGKQSFNLDFDTGSSDLWVFSTELPAAQSAGHTPLYNPSSGTKVAGATWQISYGDGSGANGDVYTDTVTIGGSTVTSQAIEAAQSVSTEFTKDTTTNGLVGLAFDNINTVTPTPQKTFFSNALASLPKPIFTADLKHQAPGSYNFGYIDSSAYTGAITYVDVAVGAPAQGSNNGFWGFTSDGYAIGTGPVTTHSVAGIADTGTTLLLLDDATVTAYYAKVAGSSNDQTAGGYIFPCTATLPDFTAVISGAKFTVPGAYINYSPNTGTTCFGGLQSSGSIGVNIFGDIFLKSTFVVFQGPETAPKLGFANKPLAGNGSSIAASKFHKKHLQPAKMF